MRGLPQLEQNTVGIRILLHDDYSLDFPRRLEEGIVLPGT